MSRGLSVLLAAKSLVLISYFGCQTTMKPSPLMNLPLLGFVDHDRFILINGADGAYNFASLFQNVGRPGSGRVRWHIIV
jgi:hypothetical protein